MRAVDRHRQAARERALDPDVVDAAGRHRDREPRAAGLARIELRGRSGRRRPGRRARCGREVGDHRRRALCGDHPRPALPRAGGQLLDKTAGRQRGRVLLVTEDRVRDYPLARLLRPLPHVVVAPAPAQRVLDRRAALGGRTAHHDRAVGEHSGQQELVERRPLVLPQPGAVTAQGHHTAAQLGGRLRVGLAQEVARAVGLVLVDHRRPLAREPVVDLRQLLEAIARRQLHVPVGEPVGPQHAGADGDQRQRRRPPAGGATRSACSRRSPRGTSPPATRSRAPSPRPTATGRRSTGPRAPRAPSRRAARVPSSRRRSVQAAPTTPGHAHHGDQDDTRTPCRR